MRWKTTFVMGGLGLLAGCAMFAKSEPVTRWAAPAGEAVSEHYRVQVNGQPVPVLACRVSAVPFNQVWPGYQRPIDQTELAGFACWNMTGPVQIEVQSQQPVQSVAVRPASLGIKPVTDGNRIRFTLARPSPVIVEINGRHHALHLFANPPEKDAPAANAPNLRYFGPGVHRPGKIELKSNESVYLAGGAVVYGSIQANSATNLHITGRGVLDVSQAERGKGGGAIRLSGCSDVTVEGLVLRDPDVWCFALFGCNRVTIDNVKLVGLWRYNADGIDVCNSQNVAVRDCFVRSYDDALVVKGLKSAYDKLPVRNVRFSRCTLWCDWGRAMEIGAETCTPEIADVVFEDCDVVRTTDIAMDIQHGDRAAIRDIRFQNIRVEIDPTNPRPRLQKVPGETYPGNDQEPHSPALMTLVIYKTGYSKDDARGTLRNVLFKDIDVFGALQPPSSFRGYDSEHGIDGVTIDNLRFNGHPVRDAAAARLTLGKHVANVRFSAEKKDTSETKTWSGDYVPPPAPVAAKITLGAYIFPGWYRDTGRGDYPYRTHDEDSEWKRCIAQQPAPRPLLGFYDDSLPEVNDWHIKWALEHGLSFFAFDWYWNAGEKRLARTLEQGFLKARYAPQMKFCIHWCNHTLDWKRDGKPAPLDFSKSALLQMTEYLADHYFKLPNYLTVDGHPVFMAFVPAALVQANGGPAGFRATLEEMNQVLRAKGLKDLYFVALGGGNYAESGFSAFTAYSYYGTDPDSKYEWKRGHALPYEDMVTHFETLWQTYSKRSDIPYIVPVGSNWDDRPRARKNALVITGKTPDLFEKMCRASLNYIDKRNNLAIIEAWNEWGEGSFIEPDKEFGFAFLDRVRKVYTDAPDAHTDVVPTEAKIASFSVLNAEELAQAKALENQPYPAPPLAFRTTQIAADAPLPSSAPLKAWEFERDAEGWIVHQMETPRVENGALVVRATGDDPQVMATNLDLDIGAIALRLKAPKGLRGGEGFWATRQEPAMSGDKSFGFGIKPDGEWHTYQITKKVEGNWSGALRTLRFDFGSAGDTILIDWIRVYPK